MIFESLEAARWVPNGSKSVAEMICGGGGFLCTWLPVTQIPGEKQTEHLRRQIRDEVEKPMRDLLDAANNDAEKYRSDCNRASRELVVVRAELDKLRAEHCRIVAELKMQLDTEVNHIYESWTNHSFIIIHTYMHSLTDWPVDFIT